MLDKISETAPIHIDNCAYFALLEFNCMYYMHVYIAIFIMYVCIWPKARCWFANTILIELNWTIFHVFGLPFFDSNFSYDCILLIYISLLAHSWQSEWFQWTLQTIGIQTTPSLVWDLLTGLWLSVRVS